MTQTLRGGIQEPWNFVVIKRMHKQWIPGSFSVDQVDSKCYSPYLLNRCLI